eukprot:COSAG05_NODE_170_length_15101_cov_28.257684_5_plen_30_part_00
MGVGGAARQLSSSDDSDAEGCLAGRLDHR